jgi:DNA mismatch repair ATPase MutS
MNQNGEAPVTRNELRAELEQHSTRLIERIYDTETNLLRAFREFATAQDVRLRKIEANLGNLDTATSLRLAQLEETVTDLRARIIQLEDRPR